MKPNWLKLSVFALLGSAGGFAYYYFIGCTSGTCPITSNPLISTGYGAMMGAILGFDSKQKTVEKPNKNTINNIEQ